MAGQRNSIEGDAKICQIVLIHMISISPRKPWSTYPKHMAYWHHHSFPPLVPPLYPTIEISFHYKTELIFIMYLLIQSSRYIYVIY